ncbi:hypothetical protein M747DRAFT_291338 [Aspergillus niger ATCC 13496]|uniref:Uncharacterized protein n=1 Tax=Aspergillus niger ATCC 13496 TaxID=1353008 RepID=A0A370CFL5_ASPNG|nr:hypothetical protein M747DRAFT_291338 [Aspergillus niger ATCC 13496]
MIVGRPSSERVDLTGPRRQHHIHLRSMQDAQIPCFFSYLGESTKSLSVADADCRWSPAMSLGETRLVCPEVLARRPGNGVEGSVHAPERATDTATRVA